MIAGQVVFNILDYKTTASHYYRANDIVDCKALQLPLYAMAVEDLLLADRKALAWHGGYWHVRDTGFQVKRGLAFHEQTADGLKRTELWANLRERLVDRVGRLIAGVRGGEFPMHCEDEHCSGRCPYKTVCRVNAVRSLEKSWQPPPPKFNKGRREASHRGARTRHQRTSRCGRALRGCRLRQDICADRAVSQRT